MSATQDEKNALYGGIPSTSCVKNYVMSNLDKIDGATSGIPVTAGDVIVSTPSTVSYRVVGAVAALDGSNPTPVATGLTTITAATVSYEKATSPGLDPDVLTVAISGGTLNVYAWKVTGAGDATLIASTNTGNFHWIAVGV